MSCTRPLTAYWRSAARSGITFDVVKSATKIPFQLPCGQCIGCRVDKAQQWGLRCLHEAKMWPCNSFVTLTYNDEFLPMGGTLSVRDVQLFMKRLRKSRSGPVRFFLGGEYGEVNRRPHYHALFFNVGFADRVFHCNNKRGEPLFTSHELEGLWSIDGRPLGFCTVGEVTMESAVYCAKYALKKLKISEKSSDEAREAYERRYVLYDADGCVFERHPEFAIMSRSPGIGSRYYEKYGSEVRALDNVVVDGRKVRPPRFYDSRSECVDGSTFAGHKRDRKRAAVLNKADNTPERLRVKERLLEIAAEKKERTL